MAFEGAPVRITALTDSTTHNARFVLRVESTAKSWVSRQGTLPVIESTTIVAPWMIARWPIATREPMVHGTPRSTCTSVIPSYFWWFGLEVPFSAPICVRARPAFTGPSVTRAVAWSQEREEVVDGDLRLLEDVRERRAFDRPMRGHDDLERLLSGVLLQADVTAVLAHDDPAAALERPDDAVVREIGDFRQTAISTSSARSVRSRAARSSSTGSR